MVWLVWLWASSRWLRCGHAVKIRVIDEDRGAANPPSSLALGLGGGDGVEPSAQPEHGARRWEAALRDQGPEPGPDDNATSEEPRWWHEARQGG